ncbi:MAG: AAA family ATPase, partial [Clostridiales bacterium]|nr:AAA family ATPase [Clostridiales bacterium]
MALPVLIIGKSGSGKTYSLKKFSPEEVGIISVEKGRLPFKSNLKVIKIPKFENSEDIKTSAQLSTARYSYIEQVIKKAKCKAIVIDDSQYLLADEFFD